MHDSHPELMWNFCQPRFVECWNLHDCTICHIRQSNLYSVFCVYLITMRFRRFGKLDLKKSLLLIVMAYLFAGLGMVLWSDLVVPTFTKTRFIVDRESLSIDKLFLQDSSSVTRQAMSVKGKYSVKIRPPAHNFSFFSPGYQLEDGIANIWMRNSNVSCSGHIVGYANEFVKFKDILLDPGLSHGRDGGENLTSVLNQAEEDEYLTFDPGFFKIKCKAIPSSYEFSKKNHLNDWWSALKGVSKFKANLDYAVETCFTIAITRYEYVNFYHTMTDFYNVFLMLIIFRQQPHNVRILWVDSHPIGSLDVVWNKLFTGYTRLKTIRRPVLFRHLVWNIMGYNSPLLQLDHPILPYVEEFREFFLRKYNQSLTKKLDCHKLNVLFIWRRDYVAHPRNPKGLVSRKIQNEAELLEHARKFLTGKHSVRGVQVDLFSMEQQLKWISETDILIGMHGAGLTHALFLPKHAGLMEFYPTYWSDMNVHFRSIARWRNLKYLKWQNSDTNNELDNYYTRIPSDVVEDMLTEMTTQLCPKKIY